MRPRRISPCLRYRHASYTDAYSRPERPLPQRHRRAAAPPRRHAATPPPAAARPPTRGLAPVIRYEGDEFPDPPDPRYPGVWDYAARSAAKADLGSLLRGGPAASPFGSSPLDTPPAEK